MREVARRILAVRHADDPIHIAATLVRGNLRRARVDRDWPKAQAACRALEKELGLRRQNTGEPTAAERRKAEHLGPHALRGMPVWWCTECRVKRDRAFVGQGRNGWGR